jgi:hypothetical protein
MAFFAIMMSAFLGFSISTFWISGDTSTRAFAQQIESVPPLPGGAVGPNSLSSRPQGVVGIPGLPGTLVPELGPESIPRSRLARTCPKGYIESKSHVNLPYVLTCQVRDDVFNNCIGQPGAYPCGREGSECCSVSADNHCFPGAYSCSAGGGALAKRACCLRR